MANLGVWNANTGTPALPSASAVSAGDYFVVSEPGCQIVSGISTPNGWAVGDKVISNGSAWYREAVGSVVTSIAGTAGPLASTTTIAGIASAVHGASGVTAFGNSDEFLVLDSNFSYAGKKSTWLNLKTQIRAWLDSIGVTAYDLPFAYAGKPGNSEVMPKSGIIIPRAVVFPVGLTGSYCKVGTNPTSTATIGITIYNAAGVSQATGSISITTGGVATFTFASAYTTTAGDVLKFSNQVSADATLSDISITLVGTLT